MRLAGFNSHGVNTEPISGMGVYAAARAFDARWIFTTRVEAAELPLLWVVREYATLTLPVAWGVREIVARGQALPWGVREIARQGRDVTWHVTGGTQRRYRCAWRVPFALRGGTALVCQQGSGRISRHEWVGDISE